MKRKKERKEHGDDEEEEERMSGSTSHITHHTTHITHSHTLTLSRLSHINATSPSRVYAASLSRTPLTHSLFICFFCLDSHACNALTALDSHNLLLYSLSHSIPPPHSIESERNPWSSCTHTTHHITFHTLYLSYRTLDPNCQHELRIGNRPLTFGHGGSCGRTANYTSARMSIASVSLPTSSWVLFSQLLGLWQKDPTLLGQIRPRVDQLCSPVPQPPHGQERERSKHAHKNTAHHPSHSSLSN